MPRFVPVPAPAPSQRFVPRTQETRERPQGAGLGFLASKAGMSLLGLGAGFAGNQGLQTFSQGGHALLNLFRGGQQIAQGQNAPGALSLGSGLGGAMSTGGALLQPSSGIGRLFGVPPNPALGNTFGTVGGALGGLAGTAGGAYALSQGNLRGAQGLVGSLGSLANLAPATWTLGGVPLSASGAASQAALAGGAELMGAGTGAGAASMGAGTYGASLGGALGSLAIPMLVGSVVENLVNFGLGEGAYGQTKLPFGRGNRFSSADNLASQTSRYVGYQLEGSVLGAIKEATNPVQLLELAGQGANLAPHGEAQIYHPTLGWSGDWDDPASPAFMQALQTMIQTGDPDLLRDFIGGVTIKTGEGGATSDNWLLTDWYRRKLVSLLPESHPVRQDPTGLFQDVPERYQPEAWVRAEVDRAQTAKRQTEEDQTPSGLEFWSLPIMPEWHGVTQTPLAPLLRAPAEYQLTPEQMRALGAEITPPRSYAERVEEGRDRAPEPESGTPEWYARYLPL